MYQRFPILEVKGHQLAGELSGGQQQMLAIAQALMPGPSVLMLDEPSAGLAPTIVHEVMDVIFALRDEGKSILLVEQSIRNALSIADTVGILEQGRLVMERPAAEMGDIAEIQKLYLGGTAAAR
jgi:branched-chain amino acid transport system ATP-binding protein